MSLSWRKIIGLLKGPTAPEKWPFSDSPDVHVISLRQIMDDGAPILHVIHGRDDHQWEFLGWENFNLEDGVMVCFKHIGDLDASITELADLPVGWHAWREAVDQPWVKEPNPNDTPTS